MMKWFRLYDETLNDPKVQRLSPHLFKFWINCLCVASSVPHRGILPPVSVVAFRLRISEERAVIGLDDLVARGLLDRDSSDGILSVHAWSERQFESDNVSARVQRHRRQRNVTETLHVTPPEQIHIQTQIQTTETEQTTDQTASRSFVLFEELIGSLNSHTAGLLEEAEKEYGEACVLHSLEAMAENGARSWPYVEAIMARHKQEGCDTAAPKPLSEEEKKTNEHIDWIERRYDRFTGRGASQAR